MIQQHIASSLAFLRTSILPCLYPHSCAACDCLLNRAEGLCRLCSQSCEPIVSACPNCARPIAGPRSILCRRCTKKPPAFASCTAVFEYGGQIAVALKRLKFAGRSDIAKTLCPALLPAFSQLAARCDVAVPIPLHRRRLQHRGYNQAQRIVLPLASACNIRVARNSVHRVRNTPPQARLPANRRRANLHNAFSATGKGIQGKRVLLLDDVATTGNTLQAASRALLRAGADSVHTFVACVAVD